MCIYTYLCCVYTYTYNVVSRVRDDGFQHIAICECVCMLYLSRHLLLVNMVCVCVCARGRVMVPHRHTHTKDSVRVHGVGGGPRQAQVLRERGPEFSRPREAKMFEPFFE